jgi:hypothetical protein
MNDNERIEAALSEIRGSACVSEDVEHWTGTVRNILTRLVATTPQPPTLPTWVEGLVEALRLAKPILIAIRLKQEIPPTEEAWLALESALSQIPSEEEG